MSGKGDKYRPVNVEKYNKNYDEIFKKGKKQNIESIDKVSTVESLNDIVNLQLKVISRNKEAIEKLLNK